MERMEIGTDKQMDVQTEKHNGHKWDINIHANKLDKIQVSQGKAVQQLLTSKNVTQP